MSEGLGGSNRSVCAQYPNAKVTINGKVVPCSVAFPVRKAAPKPAVKPVQKAVTPKQATPVEAPAPTAQLPTFNPRSIGIEPDTVQNVTAQQCADGSCASDFIAGNIREAQSLAAGRPMSAAEFITRAETMAGAAPNIAGAQRAYQAIQTGNAMSDPRVADNTAAYIKAGMSVPLAQARALQDYNTAAGYTGQAMRNLAEQDRIARADNERALAMSYAAGNPFLAAGLSIGGDDVQSNYNGVQSYARAGDSNTFGLAGGNKLTVNGAGPTLGVMEGITTPLGTLATTYQNRAINAQELAAKTDMSNAKLEYDKWLQKQSIEAEKRKQAYELASNNLKNQHELIIEQAKRTKTISPSELGTLRVAAAKEGMQVVLDSTGMPQLIPMPKAVVNAVGGNASPNAAAAAVNSWQGE